MDTSIVGLAAGIAIAIASCGAALGIGMASGKAFEAAARQPEIFGKIQGLLFTAIIFIEATAIYALVVSLLLIFAFIK
jgi:F-type H+-transporting ATPase subunit c